MNNDARRKPVAVCTKCGKYEHRAETINERCYRKVGSKRCEGVFGGALNYNDWSECELCGGTGQVSGSQCDACQGYGLEYARRR